MVFAGYGRYMNGEYVDGICNVRGGIAWYLRGMGAYARMRGECVVFVGWGSRGICGGSRSVGTGGGWAGNAWYLRVVGLLGTSVRVVFVGYGWCMGSIYSRLGLILSFLESEFRNIK